jgi:hypothetical protein
MACRVAPMTAVYVFVAGYLQGQQGSITPQHKCGRPQIAIMSRVCAHGAFFLLLSRS